MDESAGNATSSTWPTDDKVPSEIITRARAGDRIAFAEIYEHYSSQIWSLIAHIILHSGGQREDVDDVHQVTWTKVYQGLPKIQEKLALVPWIRRIAVNASIDNIRQRRRIEFIPFLEDVRIDEQQIGRWLSPTISRSEDPEKLMAERECVELALAELSPRCRICLVLHHVLGFSLQEIAEILSSNTGKMITAGTIGGYISRGKKQFREAYKQVILELLGGTHE
jgi:RNA polymerase sigma-70 factor, ECF subfamily